jgi:hypothetical protein
MANIYEDLGHLMGDLEFGESVLETMILNRKKEKANRYLREAALEIRHALSDLSDALFEITTSPEDIEDDDDVE